MLPSEEDLAKRRAIHAELVASGPSLVGLTVAQARAKVEAIGGRFAAYGPGNWARPSSIVVNRVVVRADDAGHVTMVEQIGPAELPSSHAAQARRTSE